MDALVIGFGAPYRYKLSLKVAKKETHNPQMTKIVLGDTIVSVSLGLIAGMFLADSFRRLSKSFKINRSFKENKKKMCLHILAIFVWQLGVLFIVLAL